MCRELWCCLSALFQCLMTALYKHFYYFLFVLSWWSVLYTNFRLMNCISLILVDWCVASVKRSTRRVLFINGNCNETLYMICCVGCLCVNIIWSSSVICHYMIGVTRRENILCMHVSQSSSGSQLKLRANDKM